jgi:hypothetical protein
MLAKKKKKVLKIQRLKISERGFFAADIRAALHV